MKMRHTMFAVEHADHDSEEAGKLRQGILSTTRTLRRGALLAATRRNSNGLAPTPAFASELRIRGVLLGRSFRRSVAWPIDSEQNRADPRPPLCVPAAVRAVQICPNPPSTLISTPVMYDASCEAKNAT